MIKDDYRYSTRGKHHKIYRRALWAIHDRTHKHRHIRYEFNKKNMTVEQLCYQSGIWIDAFSVAQCKLQRKFDDLKHRCKMLEYGAR